MSELLRSYYDFSQLSQAAYATLTANIGGQPYRDALTSNAAEFSTTQASDFSDRYKVLHQQTIGERRNGDILHYRAA